MTLCTIVACRATDHPGWLPQDRCSCPRQGSPPAFIESQIFFIVELSVSAGMADHGVNVTDIFRRDNRGVRKLHGHIDQPGKAPPELWPGLI
jgi:hypothetical protein